MVFLFKSVYQVDCFNSVTQLLSCFTDAVLITGSGNSPDTAELYLPSSKTSCFLPKLPDDRVGHTVESSGLICGGAYSASNTCMKWNPDTGSWDELLTLDVRREHHVSWFTGIGTYIMGGRSSESKRTTTLIKNDGTQEPGFPLQYDTR